MNQDPTRTPAATSATPPEPTTLSPNQAPGHYGPGYGENAQHLGDDAALPATSGDAGRSTLSAGTEGRPASGVEHAGTSSPGSVGGNTRVSAGDAAPGSVGGTPGASTIGGSTVVGSTPGATVHDHAGSDALPGDGGNTGNMDPDDVQARPPTRNDAPNTPGSDDTSLTFERS